MEENELLKTVTDTIYLYGCAAKGKKPQLENININAVWELCQKLKTRQTVGYAIRLGGADAHNASVYGAAQNAYLSGAVRNQRRVEATLNAIKALENAGIEVTVLKGFDFARNYSNPYCRASADSDLLIAPEAEEKAAEVLKSIGFTVKPRHEQSHHAECFHPEAGLIELHARLWDEELDILSFGSLQKHLAECQKKRVRFCGSEITVLDETHSLLFGILHSTKHFILSCCGLKMLFDIALYAEANRDYIDKPLLSKVIHALGYQAFVGAVFKVFGEFGGLDLKEYETWFRCDEAQSRTLLLHIAESDMDEKINTNGNNAQYSCYLTHKRKQKGIVYMLRKALTFFLWLAFPRVEDLTERFPYLKKHRFLYPIAVIQRAFSHKTELKHAACVNLAVHTGQYTSAEEKRIAALKQFNFI